MPAAEKSLQARIVTYTLYCLFGVILLAAVLDLPRRSVEAWSSLQVMLNWDRPEEQFTQRYAPAPYALITAVDTTLPPGASLLLVTSGRDTWRREYIVYHRLLYALAPRPVWWVAPTTPDGSWKARWWTFAPLTEQAVLAVAQAKGSTHALLFDTEGLTLPGSLSWEAEGGRLVRLETHGGTDRERTGSGASNGVRYAGPAALLLVPAALATIFTLGSTITAALSRRGYRLRVVEAGGLSWCFGLAIVTLLMFWLSALGLTLSWQVPLITATAIASLDWLALGALREGRARIRREAPDRELPTGSYRAPGMKRVLHALLLLLISIEVIFIAIRAVGGPLHVWDSWANWAIKARTIFAEGRVNSALYEDPSRLVTHLDYPLLLPLSEVWVYRWVGAPDDRVAGVITLVTLVATLCVLYGALTRLGAGNTAALLACAVLVTMDNVSGLAAVVFAETPLLLATTVAMLYLLDWLKSGHWGALVVAALGAGLLPWTKREGALLLGAILLAALLTNLRKRRAWVGVGVLAGGAVLIAGPWWALMALSGTGNAAFLPVTLDTLAANAPRLGPILQLTWEGLTSTGFNLIWPLSIAAALVVIALQRAVSPYLALPTFVLLYLALSVGTYLFSDFVPYEDHVISSVRRLAAEAVPALVAWLALLLASRTMYPQPPNPTPDGSLTVPSVAKP